MSFEYPSDILIHAARTWPNQIVQCGDESLEYKKLLDQSKLVAGALQQRGIKRGGLLLSFTADAFSNLLWAFAANFLGCKILDLRLKPRQAVIAICNAHNLEVKAILTRPGELFESLDCENVFLALKSQGSIPSLEHLIDEDVKFAEVKRDVKDACIMCCTSGTTGNPKIVVHSNFAICGIIKATQTKTYLVSSHKDTELMVIPMMATVTYVTVLKCLNRGVKLVYAKNAMDYKSALPLIEKHKVTTMIAWSQIILSFIGNDQIDFSSLKKVAIAGMKVPRTTMAKILKKHPSIQFSIGYGSSEGMSFAWSNVTTGLEEGLVPFDFVSIQIRDSNGEVLKDSDSGHIWIKTPFVASEIIGATKEFLKDGWLDTSDYGYLSEGKVYLQGRSDDLIISQNGKKFGANTIEDKMLQLKGISKTVVFGVPATELGDFVCVVYEPEAGVTVSPEQVRTHYKEHFENLGVAPVEYFLSVQKIQSTDRGKISKKQIRESIKQRLNLSQQQLSRW
mmetsp:Transcript_4344/g.4778  ORF Transcript_4344/g.4778 Transcript_4344/m.4778 type:complete len:507 (+) Transcript_4344:107-1627(+)